MKLLVLVSTALITMTTIGAADARARTDANGNRATTSRDCLTHDTRSVLESAEAHFGTKFEVVSTCREHATIRGTSHPSQHRYGRAVDVKVPASIKSAVVHWLYANASGVTMTYRHASHVHFDTGPYHKLACGGCRRTRMAEH